MKVRGERECQDCGTRWSYFETGSVACPSCGGVHSVGVGERKRQTATGATLDLSPVRERVDVDPVEEVAGAAAERCRTYVRRQGFIRGGELLDLDETYLAAAELYRAGETVRRRMRLDDDERLYFLALLRGADAGDRPDPGEVPSSMRAVRGLAAAGAVEAYARDLRTYVDDAGGDPSERSALSSLSNQRRRVVALDGDVPVRTADGLVAAARALGRALRTGEEGALAEFRDLLAGIDPGGV